MRNRIFRVYVRRASLHGYIISRDGRTIMIIIIYDNIKFAHSCTVYVGLAQARPKYNYIILYICNFLVFSALVLHFLVQCTFQRLNCTIMCGSLHSELNCALDINFCWHI